MAEFFYLYDPLCGWCYGAAPAVVKLELEPDAVVHPLATGLFAGGGRTMTEEFAGQAWANDRRIGEMTGQAFSDAYRENVLGDRAGRFDSAQATRALTAVHLTEPAEELETLHRIQMLRYVEGRDITDPALLVATLRDLGLEEAATLLESGDPAVDKAVETRSGTARRLMQSLSINGVPALLRMQDGHPVAVPNGALFGPAEALLASLGLRPDAEDDVR
jgi:putative protein-disulfide isomerase